MGWPRIQPPILLSLKRFLPLPYLQMAISVFSNMSKYTTYSSLISLLEHMCKNTDMGAGATPVGPNIQTSESIVRSRVTRAVPESDFTCNHNSADWDPRNGHGLCPHVESQQRRALVRFALLSFWQWSIPAVLCNSPTGITEPSPLVLAGPTTKPQPTLQFPWEEVSFSWPASCARTDLTVRHIDFRLMG
jgi:hypothetical protein